MGGKSDMQNKETLDEFRNQLSVEKLEPLEKRVKDLEKKCEYEHFQGSVEKIVTKTLGHDDAQKIIKPFVLATVKGYLDEKGYKWISLWIPLLLSAIAIVFAILTYFKKP